jgi:adenylate cyclase
MSALPYIHAANARQLLVNVSTVARDFGINPRLRSVFLHMAAVLGALTIIFIGSSGRDSAFYLTVTTAYLIGVSGLTATSLATRTTRPLARFVALDAALVACVLYEQLLGAAVTEDHGLTTAGLVVPFIFLSHVAMNLNARLILTFSGAVLAAWITFLAVMALRHELSSHGTFLGAFFDLDLGLALSFGFAALSTCLLAMDHNRARKEAQEIDRWRHNLARFFSPLVVADLQEASDILDLKRRTAAIMFVDLRDFTSYAEIAPASQLARVLAEYRRLVAGTVFAFGGTVDKFIGDGVMAVFGQPSAADDDAERALACALELSSLLAEWAPSRSDEPVFHVGIGVHYGTVIGGVLESGYHDEFTVIGDAVNVAQRLESLTKDLDASLVVSSALLAHTRRGGSVRRWAWKKGVVLNGRKVPIDLAYLPRDRSADAKLAPASPARLMEFAVQQLTRSG